MTTSTDDTTALRADVRELLDTPEQLRSHWAIDWDRIPARKAKRLRAWYHDRSQPVPVAVPLWAAAVIVAALALVLYLRSEPFTHVIAAAVAVVVAAALAVVAQRTRKPREWAETVVDRYHAELQIGAESAEVGALVQIAQEHTDRLRRWAPVTWDRRQRTSGNAHRRQAGLLEYVGLDLDLDLRLEQIKRAALEAERDQASKEHPDYDDLYAMVAAFCRYCSEVQSLQMAVNAVERETETQRAEVEPELAAATPKSVLLSTERDITSSDITLSAGEDTFLGEEHR